MDDTNIDPMIQAIVDAIALAIMQEQEQRGRPISTLEVALVVMARSLVDSAKWLQETLADSPDERYGISLLLLKQAELISKPKEQG